MIVYIAIVLCILSVAITVVLCVRRSYKTKLSELASQQAHELSLMEKEQKAKWLQRVYNNTICKKTKKKK